METGDRILIAVTRAEAPVVRDGLLEQMQFFIPPFSDELERLADRIDRSISHHDATAGA